MLMMPSGTVQKYHDLKPDLPMAKILKTEGTAKAGWVLKTIAYT